MYINLYILKEELESIVFEEYFTDSPAVIVPMVPKLYRRNTSFNSGFIYISKSCDLPDSPSYEGNPSIICIGTPPDVYLRKPFNVIYTNEQISSLELLDMVMNTLNRYFQWENSMQAVIDSNQSIKELGLVSIPFVKNPIYLQGAGFKCLFSIIPPVDKHPTELYKDYCKKYSELENSFLTLEQINTQLSRKDYDKAMEAKKPFLFNSFEEGYGYRTLSYNICYDNNVIARLSINEILEEFTDKDYGIIQVLAIYIRKGIKDRDIKSYNRPQSLDFVMENLLKHQFILEHRIIAALKPMKWKCSDTYFCMVLRLNSKVHLTSSLRVLAFQLMLNIPSECYHVFEDNIVFVFNLTQLGFTRQEVIDSIASILEKNSLVAGSSIEYQDFKDLYYYYQQGLEAVRLGSDRNPMEICFNYEDYNLISLIKKCKARQIASALYPQGLLRIIAYDKRKNTDNVELLKLYLKNNMSITSTTKEAYMHRNTFLYRLEKIREIMQIDFEDYDKRLELMIALKIMDMES